MKLETKITLVFKNEKGESKEIETTFADVLEKDISDYHDNLEDDCSSGSCFTEGQNHCECSPEYEDYELKGFELTNQDR